MFLNIAVAVVAEFLTCSSRNKMRANNPIARGIYQCVK